MRDGEKVSYCVITLVKVIRSKGLQRMEKINK